MAHLETIIIIKSPNIVVSVTNIIIVTRILAIAN
jgi:hypothetical protein